MRSCLTRSVLGRGESVLLLAFMLVLPNAGFAQDLRSLPDAPSESVLRSKSFVIPHALMFASIFYDGELSRNLQHHGPGIDCREANSWFAGPNGEFQAGKFYAYNLSLATASTFTNYWLRRKYPGNKVFRFVTIGFPLEQAGEHFVAGSTWLKAGC